MIEAEWNATVEAKALLDFLWRRQDVANERLRLEGASSLPEGTASWFDHALHRYYLASCRTIWTLPPQRESRRGVEPHDAGDIEPVELLKRARRTSRTTQ